MNTIKFVSVAQDTLPIREVMPTSYGKIGELAPFRNDNPLASIAAEVTIYSMVKEPMYSVKKIVQLARVVVAGFDIEMTQVVEGLRSDWRDDWTIGNMLEQVARRVLDRDSESAFANGYSLFFDMAAYNESKSVEEPVESVS